MKTAIKVVCASAIVLLWAGLSWAGLTAAVNALKLTIGKIDASIQAGPDYNALLTEWQERLNLTEWDISVFPDRHGEDMALPNTAACSTITESHKAALIEIRRADEMGENFDGETSLVHELLHCKFALLWGESDELEQRILHQNISDLAEALVEAKRGGAEYSE